MFLFFPIFDSKVLSILIRETCLTQKMQFSLY